MIIGNGLVARALASIDRDEVVFVAAGVSDSKCSDPLEYEREQKVLADAISTYPDKYIVYFSTYSINDPAMKENLYVRKKLEMEQFLATKQDRYLIVRISNLVGRGGNPKNVFNFFFNSIVNHQRFSLWSNATRNLVTEHDFTLVMNHILEVKMNDPKNDIVNVINSRSFSGFEIVAAIEQHTGIKALYDLVEKESIPKDKEAHSDRWFSDLNISTERYLEKILDTYFKKEDIVS